MVERRGFTFLELEEEKDSQLGVFWGFEEEALVVDLFCEGQGPCQF